MFDDFNGRASSDLSPVMQNSTLPGASSSSTADNESRRERRAARDFVPLLITVAAGVFCYGLLVNRGMGLPILGYNISPAERVMLGEVPYRDFVYNYTPGVLWINAALMRLFGVSVMTINAGLFAFKLAALVALFYVARRLISARAALILAALALGWVGYRVVFRAYPAQYSMLFVLLGLICMLNYDRSGKARWLLLCGAAVGVVFVFKQNVGVFVLASATATILIREMVAQATSARAGIVANRVAVCWTGFALVAAPMFGYIAYTGAFGAMLRHFSSVAGEYGDKRAIPLPDARLLAVTLAGLLVICALGLIAVRKTPRLFEPFVLAVLALCSAVLLIPGRAYAIKTSATAAMSYFPPALLLLAFAIAAWRFKSNRHSADERQQWWRSCGPIVTVALFALGAYLEMYPRADYAHLVRVLPPVFLLLLLLTTRSVPVLTHHFKNRLPAPRRAALLCAAAPLVFLFLVGIKDTWQARFDSQLRFVEQTPLKLDRARGMLVSRRQAGFIEGLAAAIEAHSSPGDPMFSFAPRGTAFYFLTGRKNPTEFVWWRSVGIKGEHREALLDKIAGGVPRLILVPDGFQNERILDNIGARYHQVDSVADIAIYERNQ